MANYYHEARAQCRNLKKSQEDNRRRAERRAELANARQDLPIHLVQIDGRQCPIHRSTEAYDDIERMSGMVAWNGNPDCMIDRFDARSMLDFHREYTAPPEDTKTEDEHDLEERLAFESYRDLVKLVRTGLVDGAGLAYVENEALDIRVAARSKASAAAGVIISKVVPAPSIPGDGMYSATNFSYGEDVADGELDDEDGDELGDAAEDDMIQAAEDDEEALDAIAADCGITHFTAQLQRAIVQEEDEDEKQFRARRRVGRRKMAERVRRMIGQGLNPYGKSKAWWKESVKGKSTKIRESRGSPEYGGGERGSRSRRENDSRHSGRPEAITELTAFEPTHDSSSSDDEDVRGSGGGDAAGATGAVFEAIPGEADPAINGGPVALPAAGARVFGRRDWSHADREADRLKQAERGRVSMNRASVAVAVAGKKETPQERMKRLMAAQFTSNVAKDTQSLLQRKARDQRDAAARVTIERHALSFPRLRAPAFDSDRRSPSPQRRGSSRRSRSPQPRRRSSSRDSARAGHSSASPRRRRSRSPDTRHDRSDRSHPEVSYPERSDRSYPDRPYRAADDRRRSSPQSPRRGDWDSGSRRDESSRRDIESRDRPRAYRPQSYR